MRNEEKKMAVAIGVAALAGIVAGSVALLIYRKPEWRRHFFALGRHLLSIAEGMIKEKDGEG